MARRAFATRRAGVHHRAGDDAGRRGTLRGGGNHRDAAKLSNEVKTIELGPCGYNAQCRVKNCKARATVIARSIDTGGCPDKQYELCAAHAEQIAERERAKGRGIIRW